MSFPLPPAFQSPRSPTMTPSTRPSMARLGTALATWMLAASAYAQPSLVTIPASLVRETTTPHSEVAAAMDATGRVHVVFTVEGENGEEDLYYSLVTGSSASTPARITRLAADSVRRAHLVLDDAGAVHLVFFVKRVHDRTTTGNTAVYYATNAGGTDFRVEQVSENPTDPAEATAHRFDAGLNDRPKISLDAAGRPVVFFLSRRIDGPEGNDIYVLVATRNAAGWSYEVAFRAHPLLSLDEGVAIPRRMTALRHVAYCDIDQYRAHLVTFEDGRWRDLPLDGPHGYTNLDDVRIDVDASGTVHLTAVAKVDRVFVHRRVVGTEVGPVETIPIAESPWSNFSPTALDLATGRLFYAYEDTTDSPVTHHWLGPDAAGTYHEWSVEEGDEQRGAVYGQQAFLAHAGGLALVTASRSQGAVFVRRWRAR